MKQKIKHFLILTIFLLSLSFLASCQKVQKEQDTQYSDSQPAGKQKIICYDVTVSAPYMEDLVKVLMHKAVRPKWKCATWRILNMKTG